MQFFRKVIFWLHLACGVTVGLVVFIMSITGVALTYEKQMLRWADGFHIDPPAGEARRLDPAALLEQAQAETGKAPGAVLFRSDPRAPARLYFGRESFAVNPYTGERLGEGAVGLRRFFRTMIVWHRWLGQEGEGRAVGKAVTGACNLAFLFIVVSGCYLWWPKEWTWKQLRPVVFFRGGLQGKARDFNWHNVFGLWCAAPLFLVVGTAAFFSYSWPSGILYALTGEEKPRSSARGGGGSREKPAAPASFAGLNDLWEKAAASAPGWKSITLRLSERPGAPVTFSLDRGNGARPDLRSTLTLDRKSGAVVRLETPADIGAARNARSWIRWLHTGEAGGFAGQTLAGAASLAACLLVYTGWMLSWRRFRAWRERTRRKI